MTANQIAYNRHLEDKRNHLVLEQHSAMQAEAAKSQADTAAKRAEEEGRHNKATETINWWSAQEVQRHNLAGESLEQGKLTETSRHNRASEQLAQKQFESTDRLNRAQSEAVLRQAAVSERKVGVEESALAETIRHQTTVEAETRRYNDIQASLRSRELQEAERTHRANESISSAAVGATIHSANLSYAANMERNRVALKQADLANSLAKAQLREQQRHSQVQEQQGQSDVETRAAQERFNEYYGRGQLGQGRSRLDIEQQNANSNTANAVTGGIKNVAQGLEAGSRLAGSIISLFGG